jgi:large subunit ribosomal protein L10
LLETKQRREKAKVQETLKSNMSAAKSVVFVDFRGLSVGDDTRLRRQCRENGVSYKVIKNTLALRAARDLDWEDMDDLFQGPTAMATSETDPVAPAKVLRTFSLEVPVLKIKGGVLDGKRMSTDRVTFLATLPSRETLLTQVAVTMKSPISSLATVLNGPLAGFARALSGLKDKKEKGEI